MVDLNLFTKLKENTYLLTKWDWDYLEAEKFQLECVEFIYENPRIVLLIVCSHSPCFTLGRGLQKIKDESLGISLVDFDPNTHLNYPLYTIKRGGGLTFHYPGQFVFYPIISLPHHHLAIFDLMILIMELTKNLLQKQFSFIGLDVKKELLGVWFENAFSKVKIASIGLAASRYITYHGLALNFFKDDLFFKNLSTQEIFPCGLQGDIYRDLETLLSRKINEEEREQFKEKFIDSFLTSI